MPGPLLPRPTNGEYWTEDELDERARGTNRVVHELAGLDPFRQLRFRQLTRILRDRGHTEIFREGGVRVQARLLKLRD